ncbi:uncharacterized protein LOC141621775 [Silene latifolia]|uniref:uncharacterized protein LOC141621775 n=1 Tax=Silene latifolia TaxID=37657 RepID=UPI003D779AC9
MYTSTEGSCLEYQIITFEDEEGAKLKTILHNEQLVMFEGAIKDEMEYEINNTEIKVLLGQILASAEKPVYHIYFNSKTTIQPVYGPKRYEERESRERESSEFLGNLSSSFTIMTRASSSKPSPAIKITQNTKKMSTLSSSTQLINKKTGPLLSEVLKEKNVNKVVGIAPFDLETVEVEENAEEWIVQGKKKQNLATIPEDPTKFLQFTA